jgi:hypothetical protein
MTSGYLYTRLAILVLFSLPLLNAAQAQPLPQPLSQLLSQPLWTPASLGESLADILNTHKGDDAREPPLRLLLAAAETYLDGHRDSHAAWSVTARIRFWYADTQSLVRGLALMAQARDELLKAIDIDPRGQEGNAQAWLGFMYFAVPPWPVSYRSKKKSADYFQQALTISDTSLSNNYLYAQVLIWQKQYPEARQRLDRVRVSVDSTALAPATRTLYLDGINNMLQEIGTP